jgi:aminocarboxymuconate-semialdehyde decarboxylase
MAGIQIFSNIGGRPLNDPEFRPFFERAHHTRTPVWIHPQLRVEWSEVFALDKLFGWPFDTSMALSQLVFSGIMEDCPDLKIITHHMGGMVPFFSERIKSVYDAPEIFPKAKFSPLKEDPLVYFRRFYGDSVLNGAVHSFECGYKFFGPDHILFATDYPFGPREGEDYLESTLRQIESVDLPQDEKDRIWGGNLQDLINRV